MPAVDKVTSAKDAAELFRPDNAVTDNTESTPKLIPAQLVCVEKLFIDSHLYLSHAFKKYSQCKFVVSWYQCYSALLPSP